MISKKSLMKTLKSNISVNLGLDFLYGQKSYSQEGEDLLINKIFQGKDRGFYVDIGAHHPYRYSNTYLLYKSGWHGINIDATPGSMNAFKRARPQDINIEACISHKKNSVAYYSFQDPALNTFSKQHAEAAIQSNQSKQKSTTELRTKTLKDVLHENFPKNTKFDLLNIDVEGTEYEVLKSNDWQKYTPKVVVVEILNYGSLQSKYNTNITKLLESKKYKIIANTINSVFFQKE